MAGTEQFPISLWSRSHVQREQVNLEPCDCFYNNKHLFQLLVFFLNKIDFTEYMFLQLSIN